jgi:hypothetical protein
MTRLLRALGLLCVLCGALFSHALDRQAFTITNYSLQAHLDPATGAFAVEGSLQLRNDSTAPQRNIDLQITSTLEWKAITANGKDVQWLSQPYTSDIDHTGALSEAIVTLPAPVQPQGTVSLGVTYGGTIPADTTRLQRLGVPAEVAARSDWDRISADFTAVRGLGYVVWYPVAMDSANLSQGSEVFDAIAAWKQRHAASTLEAIFWSGTTGTLEANTARTLAAAHSSGAGKEKLLGSYQWQGLGRTVPTFAFGDYHERTDAGVTLAYLPGQESAAADYARVAQEPAGLVLQWFGRPRQHLVLIDLSQNTAQPYESGTWVFTPLRPTDSFSLQLTFAHQWAHAAFDSPRPWLYEGAAHFAQALEREHQGGRQAALDYMAARLPVLRAVEAQAPAPGTPAGQSLVTATDEALYRTKSMYVLWMLRELVGDQALQAAFINYRPADDKEPSYFQRLVEAQSHKDLEWFFDDWVYRDRGLPDLRIAAVYPRPTLKGSYTVTVTVENLGGAAAEVPVTVRGEGGEVVKRAQVAGHSKQVLYIQVPNKPLEARVNDGSVPESDTKNNSMTITIPKSE